MNNNLSQLFIIHFVQKYRQAKPKPGMRLLIIWQYLTIKKLTDAYK